MVRVDLARVSYKAKHQATLGGADLISGATGPMARSVRDLELMIVTALAGEPWRLDPSMTGKPWSFDSVMWKGGEKPKLGIMWDDGNVKPHLPMLRALVNAVEKLKAAGFQVVDYESYKSDEAWKLLVCTVLQTVALKS